ncbi:MAG: hypothetical protein GY842_09710 [bacterium]|nr:hypothetical protein [bacterium]
MSRRPNSVVRQVQLRLLGARSATDTEASLASQIRELEDRVARLHRLGTQFGRIRVSRYVEMPNAAGVAQSCEGVRVTTEV